MRPHNGGIDPDRPLRTLDNVGVTAQLGEDFSPGTVS
jgi:hypothetical protein